MITPSRPEIPRTLHFVWVGNEDERPDNCIDTWREAHPDFEIRVWGNQEWESGDWRLRRHMQEMADSGQLYGVADLMRWEILERHGGFALDCDSVCVQRLPDWIFTCDAFTCWENELACPGLLANGYVATRPGNPLVRHLIEKIAASPSVAWRPKRWYQRKRKRLSAWKTTGPQAWTNALHETKYEGLTILPSHFFCPSHPSGHQYKGSGPVYCHQLFGSTAGSIYNDLHKRNADDLLKETTLPKSPQ